MGFQLEEIIEETDHAPPAVVAVLATVVTAGVTIWMALPLEALVVLFATAGFALATLHLLTAQLTNSFQIALKVKSVMGLMLLMYGSYGQ